MLGKTDSVSTDNINSTTYKNASGYTTLYDSLGYSFKNEKLLCQAFTRQNAIEEKVNHAADANYQRLEFLGDRIVNLVIATCIMDICPTMQEGELTEKLKDLVSNRGIMVDIGKNLNLSTYLIIGKGETIVDKMLADAVESLVAAIYLDCNDYLKVKEILGKLWHDALQVLANEQKTSFTSLTSLNNDKVDFPLSFTGFLFSNPHYKKKYKTKYKTKWDFLVTLWQTDVTIMTILPH